MTAETESRPQPLGKHPDGSDKLTQEEWLRELESGDLIYLTPPMARELAGYLRAPRSESAPSVVWAVEGKTSFVLFESEELAQKYVASFSASIGGGLGIARLAVVRDVPDECRCHTHPLTGHPSTRERKESCPVHGGSGERNGTA